MNFTFVLADAAGQPKQWDSAWTDLFRFWPVLVSAFVASLIFTPVMRKLALANGIIDLPDARRKAHAKPVAYLGGLAIFLGWFTGICVFVALVLQGENQYVPLFRENASAVMWVALGAAAIVLTGLFDDVYGMSARVKIGGQLFAAAAIAQTRSVESLVASSFELLHMPLPAPIMQVVGTAVIAVLVVGCCNALNLIDGLDGLASGVTALAMAGMLAICLIVLATYTGQAQVIAFVGIPMLLSIATIGAVLGFLPYNFNPASIFMGDTGSLLLGYLCVTTILFMGRIDDSAGLGPTVFLAATICFALPLTDTALAIVRRRLQGKPIFAPDAMHMHHMFRRCGLSVKQSVFAMYSIALAFSVTGATLVMYSVRWKSLCILFFATVFLIIFVGYRVSCRLLASEREHPKPAEAPTKLSEQHPATPASSPAAAAASPADPATSQASR